MQTEATAMKQSGVAVLREPAGKEREDGNGDGGGGGKNLN